MLTKASPSKRKVYIDSLFGERVQRAEQLRAKNQAKALAESQASSSDSKESDMEKIK
ncbi:hypothetical protein B5807_09579 [Epicoccum nigrum]|uniref:Uncharacterized protein n=1 Tax=Epicoccum nigrum TaxID=105696 RepID=A0A1Y2LPX3_EPING|nr:hypothetical protein B5807_09579 [Epicoccum nigrum]